MNYHNNNVTKYAIFIFGIIIIVLAPFLIKIEFVELWKIIFAALVILSIYVMFFYPALSEFNDKSKTGSIFVAGGIYYKGIYVYTFISALILYALFGMNMKRSTATLLQLVAFFAFLIYVYFANVSFNHIDNVKSYEDDKTMIKHHLKSRIQNLQIDVEGANEEVKSLIEEINEDLRYLSPTDNLEGLQLEESILGLVEDISNRSVLSDEHYLNQLNEIKKLIKKRKNIM